MANGHARQNRDPVADPDAISYDDRPRWRSPSVVFDVMKVTVKNDDVGTDETVVTDLDQTRCSNIKSIVEKGAITDF